MILPVIAALCVCYVSGSPWGAPIESCESMIPNNNTAQNSSAPFTVTTSSPTYMAGQTISVTLTATGNEEKYFVGFILQARNDVNTPPTVGKLTADADNFAQDQGCDNISSLTHTNKTNSMNSTHKTELNVTWTAPDSDKGDVYFVATFVQSFNKFWLNVTTGEPLKFSTTQGAAGHVTTSLAFILSCVLYNFL